MTQWFKGIILMGLSLEISGKFY